MPGKLKDHLLMLGALKETELTWTASAKEVWDAEVDRVHSQTDERKRILWSRTPQKIVRAASVFATCRFVTRVERSDMELAQALMHRSDPLFKSGMDEAQKKRTMDHAEIKLEIIRRFKSDFCDPNTGDCEASLFEIKQSFRHNTKRKDAIPKALIEYEEPKLSAVAVGHMDQSSFAAALERAIERSQQPPPPATLPPPEQPADELKKPMARLRRNLR
jgi:hypothetical protein